MKRYWVVGGALVVFLVALALVGPGVLRLGRPSPPRPVRPAPGSTTPAPGGPSEAQLMRVDEQGEVAVGVVFLGPLKPGEFPSDLSFTVYLDTHMGDLSGYDVPGDATLSNDQGETISSGFSWKEDLSGGHHRSGRLSVKNQSAAGQPFWGPQTKSLVLKLTNLAGIAVRQFEWRFGS